MRSLRHILKRAATGTGDVARAIESCTFHLNERGFTMLISACGRSGRWRKALEIFRSMDRKSVVARGVKPNFYVFSSLISVCSKAGACSIAMGVFNEMLREAAWNPELKPDGQVFEHLMRGLNKQGAHENVINLYYTMVKQRLPASVIVLLFVLEAFVKVADWDQAFKVLDEMHAADLHVPLEAYTLFLVGCANYGALDAAVEVFLTMQICGKEPNRSTCLQVIRAAAAASDPDSCLALLNSMWDSGMVIGPPIYSLVVRVLIEHQLWEEAVQLVLRMESETDSTESRKWKATLKHCPHGIVVPDSWY